MNLLVATDFSEPARHAADLGAALARRLGDTLVLAHASEPMLAVAPDFAVDTDQMQQVITERAGVRLREEAARLRAGGAEVEVRLVFGSAPEAISTLAGELDARLVVVGTHGRSAVPRFFLGSAAERIVLHAERPVLVARPANPGVPEGAPAAFADAGRPLRVVVGVDRTTAARTAIDWIAGLRAVTPVDVTFVHFYWPPEQFARLGLAGARDMLEPDEATVAILRRELAAFIGELPGRGEVSIEVLPGWGELGSHLTTLASERHADLLALGTHQRRGLKRLWLGATMQPALHAARLPVLCIPAREREVPHRANVPRVRSVLAVTDLSPLGNEAVLHACGLVARDGGSPPVVHLLHVHERHLPSPLYAYTDTRGAIAGTPVEAEYRRQLEALVPADARAAGIETQVHVIDGGYPPTAILQAAARLGVDAICIGSHGRSGLSKALMGSVAEAVMQGADRPVYVVRAPAVR